MRCPFCRADNDRVIESRAGEDGGSIRRRRECLECSHRYTTTETVVRDGVVVTKRDGRREEFDREKLVHAVRAACHKRPVDLEQITMLVEDVVDALEAQFESEIPSRAIGEGVMQRLRHVDQVAYVRFASIYKQFRDVAEFVDEVSALGKSKSPATT
jgi:transcriptional repressor NrdR